MDKVRELFVYDERKEIQELKAEALIRSKPLTEEVEFSREFENKYRDSNILGREIKFMRSRFRFQTILLFFGSFLLLNRILSYNEVYSDQTKDFVDILLGCIAFVVNVTFMVLDKRQEKLRVLEKDNIDLWFTRETNKQRIIKRWSTLHGDLSPEKVKEDPEEIKIEIIKETIGKHYGNTLPI